MLEMPSRTFFLSYYYDFKSELLGFSFPFKVRCDKFQSKSADVQLVEDKSCICSPKTKS